MSGSFGRSRSKPMRGIRCQQPSPGHRGERWRGEGGREALTLLAGFVLSFSKILSDCCLVARPLMVAVILGDVVCWYRRRRTARGR